MRTALVTVVRGRHEHLRRQRVWIARLEPQPLAHVVVSMGDPNIGDVLDENSAVPTRHHTIPATRELPLAAARNLGADVAARTGAEALVLLDVDCLPEERMIGDYEAALNTCADAVRPAAVCGRVRYLPPGIDDADHTPVNLAELGRDHPLRVVPGPGELVEGDPRMLWSLNVGMTVADWRTVGGFNEAYIGYGGEDTDFGQRLAAAGGAMWWTSGAGAFHQYHPVSDPPVEHVHAIVRNANLFRSKWGFEPMDGWLSAFERLGLAERTPDGWRTTPSGELSRQE